MKVNKLEITNFRNITHKIYVLRDVNCIEAKNHTGKTNTIQALYWLLTGKLLDGSSNDMSLKPIGKTREKVSVKITFTTPAGKEHTIERTYQEHWTKTRGSEEETLTGHDTKFLIDDLEQKKNNEALEEIKALVGLDDSAFVKTDFDSLQAMMNPQYMGEILEWKTLRQIIIGIIGDVNNDEVFASSESTLVAKETLETYDYKVDKAILYCDQQTKAAADKIVELEAQVDYVEKNSFDIAPEELKKVQSEITNHTNEIYKLQHSTKEVNPLLEETKSKLEDLEKQKNQEYMISHDEYTKALESKKVESQEVEENYREKSNTYNNVRMAYTLKQSEINTISRDIDSLDYKINTNNSSLDDLRRNYKSLVAEEFKVTGEIICPNCGVVINQKNIDEDKANFEKSKQEKLTANISKGKALKLDTDNLLKQKEEKQVLLEEAKKELVTIQEQEDEANKELQQAQLNLRQFNESNHVELKYSDNYFKVCELIRETKDRLVQLENTPSDATIQAQTSINEHKAKIEELKQKEAQHYVYENNMRNVETLKAQIKNISKDKVKYEIIKAACQQFNRTKLDILTKRLEMHFGTEVKFILVEENLKAGSWNNVCYPLIIGTNTSYQNGSTSEKVMTGIKIIEIFKRELKLPDLPILIDEIGELDAESIAHLKSFTNAQILATRVNDAYEEPTIKVM